MFNQTADSTEVSHVVSGSATAEMEVGEYHPYMGAWSSIRFTRKMNRQARNATAVEPLGQPFEMLRIVIDCDDSR
ncbi:MAG: hypothetical protein OXC91_08595 [Rhodobacteraceae bacterium]|nr:hypothetical protein [Paracoccaceae bacterium]